MLDQLSAGVAQFDARRRLSFVNQPFRRLFALESEDVAGEPPFALLLDAMRESGRLPEVRDFPAWRRDLLTDPQTSGGLLIAAAPEAVPSLLALAQRLGFKDVAVVGRLLEQPAGSAHTVRLTAST